MWLGPVDGDCGRTSSRGSTSTEGGRISRKGGAKSGVADLFFFEELTNALGIEASQDWLQNTDKVSRRLSSEARRLARSNSASPHAPPHHTSRDADVHSVEASLDRHIGNQSWPSVPSRVSSSRQAVPSVMGRQHLSRQPLPSVPATDAVHDFRLPDGAWAGGAEGTNQRDCATLSPSSLGQKGDWSLPEALVTSSATMWLQHGSPFQPSASSSDSSHSVNHMEEQRAKRGLLFTDAAHLISEMSETQPA
mmetsp:Transcript_8085/g.19851  ORF Transcript_8085/g.19851 Transcript_8085/m.19851 type:complete len:250 (+) Transcript_8085:3-752(+)